MIFFFVGHWFYIFTFFHSPFGIEHKSSITLTKELEEKVLAKVKALTNREVLLENIIDESIIGGFILQIGDKQYNASISGKLESLRKKFKKNDYKVKI